MQTKTFRGGVQPSSYRLSAGVALQDAVAPQRVIIPFKQHLGAPVRPLVEVGDSVCLGQKIGDSDESLSAPIHASVSGKVCAIGTIISVAGMHGNNAWHNDKEEKAKNGEHEAASFEVEKDSAHAGDEALAVFIENDGLDTLDSTLHPFPEWEDADRSILQQMIRESGIVDMDGVGYPLHAKLNQSKEKRLTALIISAVEAEPYLTSDYRLLLEQPEQIFTGIRVLMRVAAVDRAYIAVNEAQDGIQEALRPHFSHEMGIDLVFLENKYPQGEERQLVYAVTGQEIPSGGLAVDIGVMTVSVATAWALGELITSGMPSVRRAVTITGAVKSPGNFLVRIGTTLEDLIQAAGGVSTDPHSVILGGPMTGMMQQSLSVPISKAANGVLVLKHKQAGVSAQTNCIHCGRCVEACPCRLMPLYLAREAEREEIDQLRRYHIFDCCECASCAYICPAKIPLLHWIRCGKELALAAQQ